MNIIEAVKEMSKGKRVFLPGEQEYYFLAGEEKDTLMYQGVGSNKDYRAYLEKSQLSSTNWEIYEPEKMLVLTTYAETDLVTAANVLQENGYFNDANDVIYFFEKPWKWKSGLEELGFEVTA